MAETQMDRRVFLQSLGGGLAILFATDEALPAQESGREPLPKNVSAWLHIAPDGKITAFTGKVEVGQNARTSLTQAVAGELRCTPQSVHLVMGDTSRCPWDMGTFGSRTTPTMAPILRRMASTARELMVRQAAAQWKAAPDSLRVADLCVKNPATGKSASFGRLAARIDWVHTVGKDGFATPPTKWKVAGTSVPKLDARGIVTGKVRYPSDHHFPGMLYGRVVRPPSFHATLISADTDAAARIPGVKVVHDGDFIAVAAPDWQAAEKAAQSVHAKWHEKPQISNAELFSFLKSHPEKTSRRRRGSIVEGAVQTALTAAHKTLNKTYTVAYIAHTPMEPRAAAAIWNNGELTVWCGSQRPFHVRSLLADTFGIGEDKVRVIVPDTGGAFGGKHDGDWAVEAARIAKGAGKPVKLVWTREEEFTWAYFRPAGVIEVASGLAEDGTLTAWKFDNYLSGPSAIDTPYQVSNRSIHYHPTETPLRVGSYRGLAATANHFARESHMDELAEAMGMDPLAFRLKNLANDRIRAVLETAAKRFGWTNRKKQPGHGFGIACGTEKGGYVGCCVEIAMNGGNHLHVERVTEAWDSGAVVNPDQLKNQVEGAIMMGIGGALFEQIEFANGRILNDRLSKYRVPRFRDAPAIEAILIDRKNVPSAGAGEIPIVGIAPALANAIHDATGKRIRSMPLL
ncbi:MAG TPA: molybdopterin cofactor-binding domain-containing protein, partial [Bryobacteraceae bacterium]